MVRVNSQHMYKFIRSVLFLFDAEAVHYFSMNCFKAFSRIPLVAKMLKRCYAVADKSLERDYLGIHFPNPVGLAAGFDKNALYLRELQLMGFGSVEIGTVTPLPQKGNDKPRLFRLPKDKALINRMGFNNDGVEVVATRLKLWREQTAVHSSQFIVEKSQDRDVVSTGENAKLRTMNNELRTIVGGNIGKNKATPNELAWQDYEKCFLALYPYVDYFVVNVSSPNTPGLRELQEKDALKKIIVNLQQQNAKQESQKPILLKIAPDLNKEQIDDVLSLAAEIKLDGIIAANTTIKRDGLNTSAAVLEKIGAGGLSGAPLFKSTLSLVRYIAQKTNGSLFIIASGGIFGASEAKELLNNGASLVQVWTGFIYEGPAIVKNICKGS